MATNGKRPVQPDDFYRLRTVGDPQLSPDGRRVAYIISQPDKESDETRIGIWVAPIDGSARARRFTFGKRDHSPRWSPDGRYLAFVSNRGEESQLFVAPLDGGEARQLTKAPFGASQPAWSPDGRRIAYVARVGDYKKAKERDAIEKNAPRVIRDLRYKLDGIGFFDSRRPHVFVVDVETGESKQLTGGDYEHAQPAWSPDGRWLAFVSDRERQRFQRPLRGDLWAMPSAGGRARKLTRSRGAASQPAYSPDGRLIAFVGHENGIEGSSRNTHLYVVPANGGRPPRSVSAPLDRSVAGAPMTSGRTFAWSNDGAALLFVAGDRGAFSIYRAGVANGSISKVLGGERQIISFAVTPDGRRAVFDAMWPDQPSEVYAASLSGRSPERNLSRANDELRRAVQFGRVRRMSYRAPDGWEIEAFAVYPPGYQRGRRYPLALNIHGGPHGYHPNPAPGAFVSHQAMAAAGYVVLLPNPRGSATYGEAFSLACVKDWGGKDYEDTMAGVDELVRRGVADPERLFVGGYSYGGYMTGWTVGHTDRFRAAVIGAPVSDLVSKFGESDLPTWYPYEIGGTHWENPEAYRAHSPITYLPSVKTPVLLVHSEGDLRCPIGQSEEIFQGLKVLGKEVEFVRYPGGFHVVRTPSQEIDRLTRTIAWYDSHTPGQRPRARAAARVSANGRARIAARASTNGRRPGGAKAKAKV